MIRLRIRQGHALRLVSAFLCGLLSGFLADKPGSNMQNVVLFLLFPLLVGGAAALTISVRHPRPYLMALGTGLVGRAGITCSLRRQVLPAHPAPWGNCGPANVLRMLLIVYLLAGFALAAPGALASCLATRYVRRSREPGFPH
ncbi:MAG TPA: hypothetical protein VGF67_20010 [Ktedonobacteraceae bacterium]|jgi:hypothetical protein